MYRIVNSLLSIDPSATELEVQQAVEELAENARELIADPITNDQPHGLEIETMKGKAWAAERLGSVRAYVTVKSTRANPCLNLLLALEALNGDAKCLDQAAHKGRPNHPLRSQVDP